MRLLRLVLFLLVMGAVAAAQSTSSTTDNGQSSTQPGQAPQSPMSEQPNLQKQEQKKEGDSQKSQSGNFDVSGATSGDQDQQLGEVRLMTRYTQVGGQPEGQTRSFHIPGSNNLAEANYFLDRRWLGTSYRYQLLTMFRGTDDSSIDPEHNSVQKGFLRLYNARTEMIFGDALVNYSRLTFNQNIKGISTANRLGERWKLSTVGGVFIDRWGSLFRDQPLYQGNYTDPNTGVTGPAVFGCYKPSSLSASTNFVTVNDPQCGRPFTSAVAGARLEYAFMRDSTIGFNFSSSDDLTGTRRAQDFNTSPNPAANRVGSVDFKLQKGMFRSEGEYAYSATNFDIRPGNCVPSTSLTIPATVPCDSRQPVNGLGFQGGWGGRFDSSYRHGKWTFRGSYIRFEPNFASINARQIADLQDAQVRASYDLISWLTLDGTMRRSNDDLKNQKPYQLTILEPVGRLIFHDLPFYRKAVFEVGYRERFLDGSSPTALYTVDTSGTKSILTGCNVTSGGGMSCVDRAVRQPYAEVDLPVGTTFLTLGYERRQSIDHLKASGTSNVDRFYFGVRGIYDFGGWHVSPSMRYDLERDTHRLDPDTYLSLNQAGTLTQYVNPLELLYLDHDNNRLATASLYVETPRWFIVELQFRDASATAATPGTLTVACPASVTGPCVQSIAGPAGYSRPSYRAQVTYKIANDENKLFILSFERNSNFYFSGPSDQNPAGYLPGGVLNPINFDERIMGVTFVYKFGKRAR
ncbi:MAG: hypothetical protein ACRD3E_17970 [Terriglobales bacterium]